MWFPLWTTARTSSISLLEVDLGQSRKIWWRVDSLEKGRAPCPQHQQPAAIPGPPSVARFASLGEAFGLSVLEFAREQRSVPEGQKGQPNEHRNPTFEYAPECTAADESGYNQHDPDPNFPAYVHRNTPIASIPCENELKPDYRSFSNLLDSPSKAPQLVSEGRFSGWQDHTRRGESYSIYRCCSQGRIGLEDPRSGLRIIALQQDVKGRAAAQH